ASRRRLHGRRIERLEQRYALVDHQRDAVAQFQRPAIGLLLVGGRKRIEFAVIDRSELCHQLRTRRGDFRLGYATSILRQRPVGTIQQQRTQRCEINGKTRTKPHRDSSQARRIVASECSGRWPGRSVQDTAHGDEALPLPSTSLRLARTPRNESCFARFRVLCRKCCSLPPRRAVSPQVWLPR